MLVAEDLYRILLSSSNLRLVSGFNMANKPSEGQTSLCMHRQVVEWRYKPQGGSREYETWGNRWLGNKSSLVV